MHKTTTNMQQTTDLDFDFQMPCRYFKSSFARSLSLNNNNNNNALTLPKKPPTNEAKLQQQQQQQQLENQESLERDNEQDSPCATPPPALPARRHTANMIHFGASNQLLTAQPPHPPQHPQPPAQSARNLNLVWPMQPTHQPTQQQVSTVIFAPNENSRNLNSAVMPTFNVMRKCLGYKKN